MSVAGFAELLDLAGCDVAVIVAFSTLVHGQPTAYPARPRGWGGGREGRVKETLERGFLSLRVES